MEFGKINAKNYELNVVFTGKQYVFFNSYCGVAAVATRKGYSKEESKTFIIQYGNEHLVGGSIGYRAIIPYVKRYINKQESQFIPVTCNYEEVEAPLEKAYVTLEVKFR